MELYSFLLIFATEDESEFFQVSVSLRSIIHSYWNDDYFYIDAYGNLFPSPYGVIFILTKING